ncbi:MAG TPA: hypothetical protein P5056_00020 [Candidatus Paceibacterota bacterium]|nr:hypothetical protein [Candidatus Paceibacterota bacterium]
MKKSDGGSGFNKEVVEAQMSIEILLGEKFSKFGIALFREVDLGTAALILEVDEKIIFDALRTWKLRGRMLKDGPRIEVINLYNWAKDIEMEKWWGSVYKKK